MSMKKRELIRAADRNNSLSERVKRARETLKHVLPKMPDEFADIPLFFDNVENLFTVFSIDDDIRTKLLVPLLTNKARSSISRLKPEELNDYAKVKNFLLGEYKLTPKEYRTRFLNSVKQTDETYILFASRLSCLLNYYITSRNIGKDFDKLCQIMVADRLKECLPIGALQHVLSLEGEEWFEPSKVASLADVYVNNRGDYKPSVTTSSGPKSSGAIGGWKDSHIPASSDGPGRYGNTPTRTPSGPSVKNSAPGQAAGESQVRGTERRCFACDQVGHFARDCGSKTKQSSGRKLNVSHVVTDSRQVADVSSLVGDEAGQKTTETDSVTDTVVKATVECALWPFASKPEHTVWLPTNVEGVKPLYST